MQLNKEIITSLNNEKVLNAKALKESKERKLQKSLLIEGINTIKDIPDKIDIAHLFVTLKALENKNLNEFIKKRDVNYYLVNDKIITSLSDTITPCGAVAVVKIPNFDDIKPLSDALILDGLQDPGNMGTIIRTAAACGYNDIYCINCVDVYNSKVIRATMGGVFRVRLFDIKAEEVKTLFKNYEIIALDMNGINIKDYKKSDKNKAIIIGSESKGISDDLIKMSSTVLSLPMKNQMESLNASIAAGIVMYLLMM